MKHIKTFKFINEQSVVNEKLARGLKPLLKLGSTITKNTGEDALLDLSDKFDSIDDEYAGTIASHLDMAIELMQDGYAGDATKKLKQFNKACKDVLNGKEVGSAFESVVNEGQFSWMTQDSNKQIGSERENTIDVYMYDNKGNKWKETKYDGYGVFGRMDFYDLVATMNGYDADRQKGIDLAFGKLKTKDPKRKTLFPALVEDPRYNWKRHNFTEQPENDPDQSWYQEEESEEDYYESAVAEGMSWNDVAKVMDAGLKKAKVPLSYARDYVKSLERMAKRNAKKFFNDYGDFTEDDFIEDIEYNMANESKVNEATNSYKKGQRVNYQLDHKGGVGKFADATSKSKNIESGVIKKRTKGLGGTFKYELTNGLELYGSEIVGLTEAEFKHINKDEHAIKLAIKDVEKKARLKANRNKPLEYEQLSLNKIMLSKVLGREKLGKEHQAAWKKLKKEYNLKESVTESYKGTKSDFDYDFELALDNIGIDRKAIKKISKKGNKYEVRLSSYMSTKDTWEKLGDAIGATLIDFKKGNINIGVYEKESVEEAESPCWDGYKLGSPKTKISSKSGKRVNNCVPIDEENKIPHKNMKNIKEFNSFIVGSAFESVNEARVSADKLLKAVVKGDTSEVEGIKLSKEMAEAFLEWQRMSAYGKKFGKLPFYMLFTAAFNWGLERYVSKDKKIKDEFKELKAKAKEMSKEQRTKNESLTEAKGDKAVSMAQKKLDKVMTDLKNNLLKFQGAKTDADKETFRSEAGRLTQLRKDAHNNLENAIKDAYSDVELVVMENYDTDQRKDMASKGLALPDGSFPIKTLEDLKNAIQAYGRAKDQAKAAKFIAKRAKALGAEDLIPDTEDFQKALKEASFGRLPKFGKQ